MSYQNYLDAYNIFYELKDKYDKKRASTIKTLKKKHPNNYILIKEELQKLDNKRKCVSCRKPGGTIFEITKTHLKATCNAERKCKLNIDIKKANNIFLPDLIHEKVETVNDIKQDIMVYKLDLLFNTQPEDIVLTEFRRLKELLDENIKEKDTYQELFDKKTKLLEIENEGENKENNQFVLKKEHIKEKEMQLNNLISDFKKNIQSYKKTNERGLLANSLEIYKTTILPLIEEIRNLKNDYINIEKIETNSGMKSNLKLMPQYVIHKVDESLESQTTFTDFKVSKLNK